MSFRRLRRRLQSPKAKLALTSTHWSLTIGLSLQFRLKWIKNYKLWFKHSISTQCFTSWGKTTHPILWSLFNFNAYLILVLSKSFETCVGRQWKLLLRLYYSLSTIIQMIQLFILIVINSYFLYLCNLI